MLGFAVLGVVVFFLFVYRFCFAFVCLFVTEANCELPVIVYFFSGFYYVTQKSQHWLAEPFWTGYTVGSACIESNVLYRKKK